MIDVSGQALAVDLGQRASAEERLQVMADQGQVGGQRPLALHVIEGGVFVGPLIQRKRRRPAVFRFFLDPLAVQVEVVPLDVLGLDLGELVLGDF